MKSLPLAALAVALLSLAAAPTPPAIAPAPDHPALIPPNQIGKTVTGAPALPAAAKKYDAKALGAKADGISKDTAILQKILDNCAAAGGGEVILPPGKYLTGSLQIGSHTTLRLDEGATLLGSPDIEDYPVMPVRWEGEWRDGHRALLSSEKTENVALVGLGTIQGPPLALAQLRPDNRGHVRGPSIFEPIDVKNLTLKDFTVRYQRMWSIHMTYCENILVDHLTIRTSQTNGDGIDVDSSQHVVIQNCDIEAGDDAIALKSGRGMEAVRIAKPTSDVLIRDCKLSSSFAGLGIGTEMSGGVANAFIRDTAFLRCSQNAIFIKSRTNRGGFIENITGTNLSIAPACGTFIGIDLVTKGIEASEPVTGDDRWPRVKNIAFSNIKLDNVPIIVNGRNVAAERPIDGLSLTDISGSARQGLQLSNMTRVSLQRISASVPGTLLTLTNVQGDNLDEAHVKAPAQP
jgi:polygalacturonase